MKTNYPHSASGHPMSRFPRFPISPFPYFAISAFCLLTSASLHAQDATPAATLSSEQQKALDATRVGEAPKMPNWMRSPAAPPSSPTLDPAQVELLQAEMARQKEQADQFAKTHDRLHGSKSKDGNSSNGKGSKSSSDSKDPSGKTSGAGDFVENYLTVTDIIERDEGNGDSDEKKAKDEADKVSRGLESKLTGVSEALLGGGPVDALSALADRLGGIAVGAPPPPPAGTFSTAGRNPYLGASGGGSYALGADGTLATRGQSSNPYLAAGNAAARRTAPVYTAPITAVPTAAVTAPPPPPPPPAPTAVERQRTEEARQKRLFPNKDSF